MMIQEIEISRPVSLILTQVLCLIITLIACRGDQSEETPIVIFLSLIPGVGYLVAGISILAIGQRALISKGRCILGHDLELTYDSEAEKWKNGRMPMRVSVGGYTKYKCNCCSTEKSYSWKAF